MEILPIPTAAPPSAGVPTGAERDAATDPHFAGLLAELVDPKPDAADNGVVAAEEDGEGASTREPRDGTEPEELDLGAGAAVFAPGPPAWPVEGIACGGGMPRGTEKVDPSPAAEGGLAALASSAVEGPGEPVPGFAANGIEEVGGTPAQDGAAPEAQRGRADRAVTEATWPPASGSEARPQRGGERVDRSGPVGPRETPPAAAPAQARAQGVPFRAGDTQPGAEDPAVLAEAVEADGADVPPITPGADRTTDEGVAAAPAGTRTRASEEFQGRSERLWGMWLRGRTGPASSGHGGHLPRNAPIAGRAVADPQAPRAGSSWMPDGAPAGTADGPAEGGVAATEEAPSGSEGRRASTESSALPPARELPETREAGGPRTEAPASASRAATPPGHQVAHAVRVAISRGSDRVTIRLEPESLGKVQVELVRDGGGMTAHFRVETPQAQQALTGDVGALRQSLEAKGIVLAGVHVELDDGASPGRNQGEGGRPRRRRGREVAGGPDEPRPLEGVTESPPAARSWRPWGFETRI